MAMKKGALTNHFLRRYPLPKTLYGVLALD